MSSGTRPRAISKSISQAEFLSTSGSPDSISRSTSFFEDAPIAAEPTPWEKQLEISAPSKLSSIFKSIPKQKAIVTFCICFTYIQYGASLSMLGPTLKIMSERTNVDVTQLGWIFTVRGLGGALGGSLSGKVIDKLSSSLARRVCIISSIIITALCIFSGCALSPNFILSIVLNGVGTTAGGYLNVFCNSMIGYIWREKSTTFLQVLHFSFGVGAVTSPLIVAGVRNVMGEGLKENLWDNLTVCYLITFTGLLTAAFMLLFCPGLDAKGEPKVVKNQDIAEISGTDVETPGSPSKEPRGISRATFKKYLGCVLVATCLYINSEGVFNGLLFTYVTFQNLSDDHGAALLNSLFWLSFTLGRLAAIFISAKVKVQYMLMFDVIGLLSSFIVMLIFKNSLNIFSVALVVVGFSYASVFPSTISLPRSYMGIETTGSMTSFMIFGASLGGMTVPLLVTSLLRKVGPEALLYCCIISGSILLTLYIIIFVFFKNTTTVVPEVIIVPQIDSHLPKELEDYNLDDEYRIVRSPTSDTITSPVSTVSDNI